MVILAFWLTDTKLHNFSKFYGKVGVIFWFLFREKTPQNNFSSQNFSVENNYCSSSVTHVIVSPEENIKIGHGIRVYSYFHLFKPRFHDITSYGEKYKNLQLSLAKVQTDLCCEKLKFHLFKKRSQTVIYYILGGE